MELVLHEDITANLTRQLLEHQLDAALLATPVEEPELIVRPLYEERFWFAHPVGHPFARDKVITAEHLSGNDLLLLTDGHCLADQVLGLCRASGLPSEGPALRVASMETLVRLVGKGFGYTLIPELAVREGWLSEVGVVARPIAMEDALRRVTLVYRRSFPRKQAIDALATVIQGWAAAHLAGKV